MIIIEIIFESNITKSALEFSLIFTLFYLAVRSPSSSLHSKKVSAHIRQISTNTIDTIMDEKA
jgi:hypothetical protein